MKIGSSCIFSCIYSIFSLYLQLSNSYTYLGRVGWKSRLANSPNISYILTLKGNKPSESLRARSRSGPMSREKMMIARPTFDCAKAMVTPRSHIWHVPSCLKWHQPLLRLESQHSLVPFPSPLPLPTPFSSLIAQQPEPQPSCFLGKPLTICFLFISTTGQLTAGQTLADLHSN